MKVLLLTLSLFCIGASLYAQSSYSIRGSVEDTSSTIKLKDAAVSVLNAKDSILLKFAWTGADGSFLLNDLSGGNLILLVTYPGYADYAEQFHLDPASQTHNFGRLYLITRARLLAEVIIRARAAIVIKGDTTEFNAEKFVIQPNSKVEDLLIQLPGIQVDNAGNITAHGQRVSKVLVDGEEFFGDDPTLVTRNIRADMVDKVQLYDEKSPQAKITGIDDGRTTKTMNVVLKEDKKNGYFGKADAGIATDELYQGQAMFNSFRTKSKFAVYGTAGTTGKIGLSFADGDKYGATPFLAAGVSSGGVDELETFSGRYDGRGIPLARSGGAHYDGKWNKDKESINVNYKIGSLEVEGSTNTISQNPLPLNVIFNNSNQVTANSLFRQKLDAAYQVQLDSSSTLKITVDGTLRHSQTSINEAGSGIRSDNTYLYRNARSLSSDADQTIMNAGAFWSKKFRKPRRTMSLTISQSLNDDERKGFLYTTNQFYNTSGTLDSTQYIDQYKTVNTKTSVFNTGLTWSEPISKTLSVVFNYRLGMNVSSNDRRSFNKSVTVKYETPDREYTNSLEYNVLSNQGGINFTYNKGKTNLNFGTNVIGVRYKQTDIFTGTNYKRNFLNWNPDIRYSYRFSQQKSLGLSYSGSTTQPGINQIQPLKVNDDPLNIIIGNSRLKPSYTNTPGFFYSSYKVLSSQSFSMNGYYSFVTNPISNNITIDPAGKRTSQWVNITGKTPLIFSLYTSLSRKLKKPDLQLGLNFSPYISTSFNLINNILNKTQRFSYTSTLSASKTKLKAYGFSIGFGSSYTYSVQSLQKDFNDNRWGLNSSVSFTVYLPGKTEISSNASYVYTQKTQAFGQTINPLIWNSIISKKFLKSEGLKFSIAGNDLLKQNAGFSRGLFSQSSYITIQRYFMGSVTWDFSKMGTTKSQN